MGETARGEKDEAAWIRDCIVNYVASDENSLHLEGTREPAWAEPLVGFSRGGDPLYRRFKDDIGPFFWTPSEIFATTFPGLGAAPGELTVVSWILPQTEQTRLDNSREKSLPADRWILSRKYGEDFNIKLRDHLAGFLKAAGHEAVAPMNSPGWQWEKSARYGLASSWSERHAAYASGLGTFGLCQGESDALRLRRGPDRRPAVGAALRQSPCVLPLLLQRELRQMHRTLPGRRHQPGGGA
jgi:epoxyqueuosine reductase